GMRHGGRPVSASGSEISRFASSWKLEADGRNATARRRASSKIRVLWSHEVKLISAQVRKLFRFSGGRAEQKAFGLCAKTRRNQQLTNLGGNCGVMVYALHMSKANRKTLFVKTSLERI